jgi:hypothetical protein
MLGSSEQFCSAFFHMHPLWELGLTETVCIRRDWTKCNHKNITLICRVLSNESGKTLKTVRYTNCYARGRRPIHAEEFMIEDKSLLVPNSTLILYDQLQPCHHSGGKDGEVDDRSCTEILISWYQTILVPLNISLKIECGSIYKAMWQSDIAQFGKTGDFEFTDKVVCAKDGIRKIFEAGIEMTMISEDGWQFLLSLTKFSPKIITERMWQQKHSLHKQMGDFLRSMQDQSLTDDL